MMQGTILGEMSINQDRLPFSLFFVLIITISKNVSRGLAAYSEERMLDSSVSWSTHHGEGHAGSQSNHPVWPVITSGTSQVSPVR